MSKYSDLNDRAHEGRYIKQAKIAGIINDEIEILEIEIQRLKDIQSGASTLTRLKLDSRITGLKDLLELIDT